MCSKRNVGQTVKGKVGCVVKKRQCQWKKKAGCSVKNMSLGLKTGKKKFSSLHLFLHLPCLHLQFPSFHLWFVATFTLVQCLCLVHFQPRLTKISYFFLDLPCLAFTSTFSPVLPSSYCRSATQTIPLLSPLRNMYSYRPTQPSVTWQQDPVNSVREASQRVSKLERGWRCKNGSQITDWSHLVQL